MVERTSLTRVDDHPRTATGREWEVFVRESESAPLRSVGSVTAPTSEAAHEQASALFAWYATELWLCPADEVVRYTSHDLAAAARATDHDETALGQ
ncbi:Htur_1727 family rSAM-partnered candidate RiPP [Halorarius litoreus]|uniref:Htur_1727 family rSAM-partnered candidate RiPP n=1 Tax=Halorarius litoreus TaxID=2962676 RepID=UPI0020CEF233|nr:Htur_1727 family rSAM-partnered candidate RiPP [Halorarius litoreus]